MRRGEPGRAALLRAAGLAAGTGIYHRAAATGARHGRVPQAPLDRRALAMQRFAELLEGLVFQPARNGKLRLIETYFREAPDPDRGYGLAALTGSLVFTQAKPALIRGLVELPGVLTRWLDAMDATQRWALLKLITGELRVGVSARLAKTALANYGGIEGNEI